MHNPDLLARAYRQTCLADRQTCLNVRNWHIPPALDPKSLQTSCDLLWQVRAALPLLRESDPTGSVLDTAISERFRSVSTPDDSGGGPHASYPVELGFGLSRELRRFTGATAECEVTLVSSNGALVGWSATCRLDAASQEIVEGALGGDANFTIVHEFPRALKRSRQALDRKLGRLTEVHERSTATSAYAVLMSPFEALVVGSGCGIVAGSGLPKGRDEIGVLASARRIDLIRNILRGPNPEARIYAAWALERLGAVAPADQTVIAAVMNLPISINTCSGCIFSSGGPRAALADMPTYIY
jgi:hypothetical protein